MLQTYDCNVSKYSEYDNFVVGNVTQVKSDNKVCSLITVRISSLLSVILRLSAVMVLNCPDLYPFE